MAKLTETVQSGDWKAEKHVPVIHIDKKDDGFKAVSYTHLTLPTKA